MAKAIVAIIVVAAIALGALYFFGGQRSFDPTEQGRKAKAAVTTGMTWTQVTEAAGDPHRYRIAVKTKKKVGGEDVEVIEPGTLLKFDRQVFTNDLAAKNMPHGFVFYYTFSHQAAFSVTFDGAARVTSVQDEKTMADLLDSRGG